MKRIKSYALPNGVRIILMPSSQTVDAGICVAVLAGSRFEPPRLNGITHMLEHLLMNGFRSPKCRSYTDYARLIDRNAVFFDVTTSESTLYFTAGAKRARVNDCVDLMARTILHPKIDLDLVQRERRMIRLEEFHEDADVPAATNGSALDLLYRGHALARPIRGTTQSLDNLTIHEIRKWHRAILRGDNIVCVVTGNFDPATIEPLINERFRKLPRHGRSITSVFHPAQQRPRLKLQATESPIIDLCLVFPTIGFSHPDRFVLTVLNNHLGARDRWSNRLYLTLTGEHGVSYRAWSELWHHGDTGSLAIATATDPEMLGRVLRCIADEIHRLCTTLLTPDELKLAKDIVKQGARDRKYIPPSLAEFHALQALIAGETVTDREFCKTITPVRARDVRRAAQRLFVRNAMCLVLKGAVGSVNRRKVFTTLRW